MQKIPYMLVIGDREVAEGQVSPRRRDGSNLGAMTVDALAALVQEECRNYK